MIPRWLAAALFLPLAPILALAEAEEPGFWVGVRAGFNDGGFDEDVTQYELVLGVELPWAWGWEGGWRLQTYAEATAGAIRGGDDTHLIGWLGPGLLIGRGPWSLDLGTGIAGLGGETLGADAVGGQLQFISFAGLQYEVLPAVTVGYRYQHMSNASIEDPNPSINMHMFELDYHY